jgi:hypothetical protein
MPQRPKRHRNSAVVGAYIRPSHVSGPFCDSLVGLMLVDGGGNQWFRPPGGWINLQSSPRVAEARSQVVDGFLKPDGPFRDADWLWWIDADMTFEGDVLDRLMDVADAEDRPIVGGLCFGGSDPSNLYPTIYDLGRDADGGLVIDRRSDYPPDTLVGAGATGGACVLVHRTVFVKMAAAFANMPNGSPNPYPWYAEGHVDHRGVPVGEDIVFCIRAQALGIPVTVDTSVKLGHHKSVILDEARWYAKERT